MVYLNPVWEKEWAGELVLFNSAGDTVCSVLPRPGRAALIPGDIVHAARGVSRQCPAVRVCVAFKSRLPTREELAASHTVDLADKAVLYVDPVSNRVVYVSTSGDVPTRCVVVEGAKQEVERVFTPAMLERVEFAGALPARMYAQNSWNFKLSGNALIAAV